MEVLHADDGIISFVVSGENQILEDLFRNESGGHRFQQQSPNDKRGRTHTSTVTVVVLNFEEQFNHTIDEKDVEFTFIKASTSGGQHANKTETGVRAVHKDSGITVVCKSERSQWQNKQTALKILESKLNKIISNDSLDKISKSKKQLAGSGMRGDKIRTIRFQDNIVKCEITGKKKNLKSYLDGDIQF